MTRVAVRGTISSAGFADGNRFVIGCWENSPLGPMADVMWGTPDGRRVLLAPSRDVADFVTAIYDFDEVRIGPLDVQSNGRRTTLTGHGIAVDLLGGRTRPVPVPRPLAVTRWIEAPIARALMGVETFGTSPRGAVEWYQTRGWRWVASGSGSIDGRDLGALGAIEPPLQVGFSEPPPRPSIVRVHVTIDLPESVALVS